MQYEWKNGIGGQMFPGLLNLSHKWLDLYKLTGRGIAMY